MGNSIGLQPGSKSTGAGSLIAQTHSSNIPCLSYTIADICRFRANAHRYTTLWYDADFIDRANVFFILSNCNSIQ